MHKSNSKLTKERLTKMYVEKRMSSQAIAEKLGCSPAGVYLALARFGIPRRNHKDAALQHHGVTKLPWKKIAKEYEGKDRPSVDVLAKKYGVANTTVTYHLRRLGVTIRPKGLPAGSSPRNRVDFDVQAAIKKNKAGKTLTEISEELGISYGVLQYRLRQVDYSPRKDLRAKSDIAKNYQYQKRKVLEALGTEACMICGETRVIDLAHIAPKRNGHKLIAENTLVLCPTHHRLFDCGKLNPEEVEKIRPRLEEARRAGFDNSHYQVKRPPLVGAHMELFNHRLSEPEDETMTAELGGGWIQGRFRETDYARNIIPPERVQADHSPRTKH